MLGSQYGARRNGLTLPKRRCPRHRQSSVHYRVRASEGRNLVRRQPTEQLRDSRADFASQLPLGPFLWNVSALEPERPPILTPARLQLDIGIIAACAPTLRPLLGQTLNLSPLGNPYRDANYYRASKALDRLPRGNNGGEYGYVRRNTTSGGFVELFKGEKQWAAAAGRGGTGFSGTAIHAEHARKGETAGDRSGSEGDTVLPLTDDPEFRGIVKTTEFRVEE